MIKQKPVTKIILTIVFLMTTLWSQSPDRVGTTAASFLELGIGSAANAMGEAYVSLAGDLTSIYWNPAGLASMERSSASFMYQPWVVDINNYFSAAGVVIPNVGTIGLGMTFVDYGDIIVTTVDYQDGTGEVYSPGEFAASLSFGRKIVSWFAFGASAKFVSSNIKHTDAKAFALDLGAIVTTDFFTPTGKKEDGMKIGMSISNYGTRMTYRGIDTYEKVDILPDEDGNYGDALVEFKTDSWELPLIFRIGTSVNVVKSHNHRLTIAVDALHPNNNEESVNVGGEYEMRVQGLGSLYARSGYKGLFMDYSQYGATFGAGLKVNLMGNQGLVIDYSRNSLRTLGDISAFTVSFVF